MDIPHVGPDNLLGVASTSKSDVWAVGYTGDGEALIEHWDGSTWTTVASPPAPDSLLTAVAALSPTDAWAVGGQSNFLVPFSEHWDGVAWSVVPLPSSGDYTYVNGVAAVASDDVWAVGAVLGGNGLRPMTVHWDGTSWQEVPSPPVQSGALVGVSAISSTDVWAVGSSYAQVRETLTEHWDGTSWAVVPSPNGGTLGSWLTGVAGLASDDLWAVGAFYPGPYTKSLTEHWDGSAWTAVRGYWDPSGANALNAVAARAASDVWAVGSRTTDAHKTATMAGRWDGTTWRIRRSRNLGDAPQLFSVTVTSDGFGWAVGTQGTATGGSLVERACGI